MAIATSMKELTQDILSSSEVRGGKLTELKEETRTLRREAVGMVKDFSTSRSKASRQLRQQLAQSTTDRRKQVMESRDDAQNLLKGFQASRQDSGAQLRQELAQGRKDLVQNEKERKQEVGNLLDNFQNSRQETNAQLRKDLAEGKAKMKSEVKETLADAEALISDYQSSRRTMSAHLKNDLSKNRDARKAAVETMRHDFRSVQSEVRADLNKAADAWQGMASTIRTKRAGGKTLPEVKAETLAETVPDVREKLLSIINQHVGGITLSEVAKILGMATVVLGKAAKTLQEEAKIRREGKLYFPVTT